MKNQFNRREFLKQSAAIGAAAAVSSLPIPSVLFGKSLNTGNTISVVNGTNYFQNTFKALEMLGGINKFVQKGKTVGLLINSPFKRRAACTNPDVSLAVLKMCFEAGAKDVYSIEGATSDYWQRSSQFNSFTSELNRLQHNFKKIKVQISKGKSLKEAEISETLLKCDVFINIPIVKHH